MRQKLFGFLGLAVLIVVLVGLNAISYRQKETEIDLEGKPNRSTFNLGATGTRAFFDLLAETGEKPVRWQSPPAELLIDGKNQPSTFVIIGTTRKPISEGDADHILRWVSGGGKLVLIDRSPSLELTKTSADWRLNVKLSRLPQSDTDSTSQPQMTAGFKAALPVQPTVYTKNINGVQTSVFAASVDFERLTDEEIERQPDRRASKPTPFSTLTTATPGYEPPSETFSTPAENDNRGTGAGSRKEASSKEPPAAAQSEPAPPNSESEKTAPETGAPVVHLAADGRNVLVDVPYGAGQIVFLSDPYIVANGGINLADNAQLAINVVASRDGIIAFDEYHQGYGASSNRLLEFFAGTPVIPIFAQLALLVGLLFFSQSRRFARPVPEPEPNRLSKLEYVGAMAELQQRAKGYDLAIENIYTDFRRRAARLVGVDAQKTRRQDLALLLAERLPDENAGGLEELMRRCEDVMHGDKTNKKEVLQLTTRLRKLEEKLGLRRKREKNAL